jgi:hypothetical protein
MGFPYLRHCNYGRDIGTHAWARNQMFVIHCGKRAAVTRQLVAVQQLRPCVWYQGLCAIASSTDHSGTERKREKKRGKQQKEFVPFCHVSFLLLFRCSRCTFACALLSMHTGRPPQRALFFSHLSVRLPSSSSLPSGRERERGFLQGREIYEQIVRCEGCIIVRIIRMTKKKKKRGLPRLFFFFFSLSCAQRSFYCALRRRRQQP